MPLCKRFDLPFDHVFAALLLCANSKSDTEYLKPGSNRHRIQKPWGLYRMTTRRRFLIGASAAALTTLAAPAVADQSFWIPWRWRPRTVEIAAGPHVGSIFVDTANTWLYHVTDDTQARRYKVAVGAAGRQFTGTAVVRRRAEWPSWVPTANMIRMEPEVYGPYRRGLPGGHDMNPMGSRALYLYRGSRDTLYRIHGTPQPWTMGQAFSSGCVRLINDHIDELYENVPLGTVVSVG